MDRENREKTKTEEMIAAGALNTLDDNYVSDEELEDLTRLDYDRSVVLNLAGELYATRAYKLTEKLTGIKVGENPLKPRYMSREILSRIEELEEEFRKEELLAVKGQMDDPYRAELKSAPKEEKDDMTSENYAQARFYRKAMSKIRNIEDSKNNTYLKIKRNFKLFTVVAVIFAAYYAFNILTHNDDRLSVQGIQSKLPLPLDRHTLLTGIKIDDLSLKLDISLAKEAFYEAEDPDNALDLYINRASSNFCKIKMFSDMIKSGRKVLVSLVLNTDSRSYHREFSVDKCEIE